MSETRGEGQSACPHPETVGTRWGDPISVERQAELQAILDEWYAPGADHGERKGTFDGDPFGVRLTGGDVSWLAERVRKDDSFTTVPDLDLEISMSVPACEGVAHDG